jgi:hypothetical protein
MLNIQIGCENKLAGGLLNIHSILLFEHLNIPVHAGKTVAIPASPDSGPKPGSSR